MKRHCSLAIKAKERKATKKRGEGITEKPLETQNRKQKKKKKHRDELQQEKRRGRTPISWVQTSITIDHRLRLRLRFPIISQATT
jgi:hypothetical protein